MWLLRNLKKFGASEEQIFEVYLQQIRSVSEMVCPVWNSGLTQHEVRSLERVQRTAVAVIRLIFLVCLATIFITLIIQSQSNIYSKYDHLASVCGHIIL